jgi:hypothetical protein
LRPKWLLGTLALLAAATAWGAAPAAAQDTASVPPAVRERALHKLRLLERALRPDSAGRAQEAPDSGGVVAPAAVDSAAGQAAAGGVEVPAARPMGPPSSDSILAALLGLQGYTSTEYTGKGARFGADSGRLELLGKAQVTRGRESLTADSLIMFSERRNVMCGYGNPVLTGEGNPVSSEQVCYSLKEQQGEALRATTTFSQGANWIVHGDRVYTVESDRAYVHSALFTDCDLEEPHYHFAAERVKLVSDDVLVARNVTLNFGDVPVFWLPFLVQSLKQGRRSGLLTPVFSVNDIVRTSDGYNRRVQNVGFYWAIDDHLGAELALDWFSNNWTALNGSFQYRYLRQFLEGSVTVRRFWQQDGGRELTLTSSNRWRPGERTSVRLDASYASSSDFVRRNSFDPLEQIRTIDSNGGFEHRMDWGSLSVGASRRQYLDDGKVQMTLPSVGLSINNVTLFRAPTSEARWYNNATWTGSAQARISTIDVRDTIPNARDETTRSGGVRSTFTLGKFSWGQTFDVNEQIRHAKQDLDPTDTIPGLSREALARMTWSTDLRYQQRLIGTSTLEPGLSLRGEMVRSDSTGQELLAGPTRLNFDARLRTEIYGLWPGVGPFERIRHKLTPSVTYTYSPEPTVTERQRAVFGPSNVRERNRIQVGLNQTFEAKYRESAEERAARDSAAAAAQARGASGEPVELPQPRRITLLALSMSAIAYDFVKAREDHRGLESEQLTTTVSSDLLRGLQLSFTTDLFRTDSSRPGGRAFDTHLRAVNASFSLDHNWWLFRLLGLGPGERGTEGPVGAEAGMEPAPEQEAAPGASGDPGLGLLGGRRTSAPPRTGGVSGTWNASISYSLARPRPGEGGGVANTQFLRANFTLQPTEYWSLHWTTSYSITEGEFGDHYLTLRRDLHDWEANFDFIRGINGNFSFQFRVQLRANPDIKVDYDQRGQRPVTAR